MKRTIDICFGSSKKKEKLGKFWIKDMLNPNTTFGNGNRTNDTYFFKKEQAIEMQYLLENYSPVRHVRTYKHANEEGAIYQVGDCAVQISISSLVDDLHLSIYNHEFDKRIETLKMLDEAFASKRKH